MTIKAAVFLVAFLIIGALIAWRMQPTKPTFVTACGIPVYSPDHTVDESSMAAAVLDFLVKYADGDCSRIDMLRIRVRTNGYPCKSSPSGRCAGHISGTLIHVGYFPDMRDSALVHELHHWIRGDTGWNWSHPDSGTL